MELTGSRSAGVFPCCDVGTHVGCRDGRYDVCKTSRQQSRPATCKTDTVYAESTLSSLTGPPEVIVASETPEALHLLYENELRHRRIFLAGRFELAERERCVLVIVHPNGKRMSILAEAVYISHDASTEGLGLDLVGLDQSAHKALEQFVRQSAEERPSEATGARNIYDRIRQLGLREREQIGRQGVLSDRVALERIFGSSVWEPLLQNPQLTAPEVAHVAKNGTLPVPLVAVIVANGAWLASGEVRRALLSNPRVAGPHLDRVLKATPRNELKQLAASSPYRQQVRAAAKKMLGE